MGHYNVRPGQIVYINDKNIFGDQYKNSTFDEASAFRDPDVLLRFHLDVVDPMLDIVDIDGPPDSKNEFLIGYTGHFGGDVSVKPISPPQEPLRFSHTQSLPVYRVEDNLLGCNAFNGSYEDVVLLTYRGDCTFLQKLVMARDAGAAAVLVVSDEEAGINPTAEEREIADAGDISGIPILVLTRKSGTIVDEMISLAEREGFGQLMVSLDPEGRTPVSADGDVPPRILYLNGHALLNTRLLV